MPSDPKEKAKREAAAKAKAKSSSSKSSKKPSSSSSSSKSRSSGSEDDKLVLSYLKSHAGYLQSLILPISSTTSIPPKIISILFLAIFLILHLFLPLFLIPHLSASITLIIPVQNSITCIITEKGRKNKADTPQWLLYWIIYCLLGWIRGAIQIWVPNTRGIFEIARSATLVLVGGPWFGRAGLRPEQGGSSGSSERKSGSGGSSQRQSRSGGSSKDPKRKDDPAKKDPKKSK